MAKETKIAWAHGTFNPWRGCTKVSEACRHCYAEGWAKRTGKDIWGPQAEREHASEAYWKQPEKWNAEAAKKRQPFRVFCSSLADVCEDREDLLEPRARLMRLIEQTPALTWLLCTKRPENFVPFFGRRWGQSWPKNVWALTTVENRDAAKIRLPHLAEVPATVIGVSYEPALEFVDFLRCQADYMNGRKLDWLIVGGESGGGARAFWLEWARHNRAICTATGTAFFMKQLGARPVFDRDEEGSYLRLGQKGDDPTRWPSDLRVQEFPQG